MRLDILIGVLVLAGLGCGDDDARTPSDAASNVEDASSEDGSPPDEVDAGRDASLSADAASQDASELDAGPTPERCIAATTQAACDAVQLPQLENCDDCGHDCAWLQLHEVELSEGQCSYGEASGVCTYARYGEESTGDIAAVCNGEAVSSAFWIDRSTTPARVGFNPFGFLTRPRLERCGTGDDPFALAAECHCPCLPGYPDAECTGLDQGFRSGTASGIEYCPGVPHHRSAAPSCVDPPSSFACESERGTCSEDVDCDDGLSCLENDGFCSCTKHCATDADCSDGESCVCHTHRGPSVCVPSQCSTDGDCMDGDVCAVSYGQVHSSGGCEPKALACRQPYVDCDGTFCASDQHCAFDLETDRWGCASNDRCQP
jgi:hypothetical protein